MRPCRDTRGKATATMDIGLLLRSQPVRRAVCGLRLRPCMALRTAGNTFAAIGASGGNGTGGMRRRFTGHAHPDRTR